MLRLLKVFKAWFIRNISRATVMELKRNFADGRISLSLTFLSNTERQFLWSCGMSRDTFLKLYIFEELPANLTENI